MMEVVMGKGWIGDIPEKCEICSVPLKGTFIDGRVKITGLWAVMCAPCHVIHGIGLGTGKGQLYNILGEKLKG